MKLIVIISVIIKFQMFFLSQQSNGLIYKSLSLYKISSYECILLSVV